MKKIREAGVLRDLIRRSLFAVAPESSRYAITGLPWEMDDESGRLVGTDGRRLAFAQGTAIAHARHTTNGLWSRMMIFDDSNEHVRLALSDADDFAIGKPHGRLDRKGERPGTPV